MIPPNARQSRPPSSTTTGTSEPPVAASTGLFVVDWPRFSSRSASASPSYLSARPAGRDRRSPLQRRQGGHQRRLSSAPGLVDGSPPACSSGALDGGPKPLWPCAPSLTTRSSSRQRVAAISSCAQGLGPGSAGVVVVVVDHLDQHRVLCFFLVFPSGALRSLDWPRGAAEAFAGVSGLICARALCQRGPPWCLLELSLIRPSRESSLLAPARKTMETIGLKNYLLAGASRRRSFASSIDRRPLDPVGGNFSPSWALRSAVHGADTP